MWEVGPHCCYTAGARGLVVGGSSRVPGSRVYLPRDVERCLLVLKEARLVKQGQSLVLVVWVRYVGTRLSWRRGCGG